MSLSFYWHECLLNGPLGSLFMCLCSFYPLLGSTNHFSSIICPYITGSLFMCLCSFYPLLGSTNHFSSNICPYYQQWLSYHSLFIHDSMNIWLLQITFDLYFSHKTWVHDSNLGHLMLHSRSKPVLGFPCISLAVWTNSPVAYSRNWALVKLFISSIFWAPT
jgi:hypothetical protein